MAAKSDPHAPKQARSEETRKRILAAGYELLNRGAFASASIADIAREAGCSVGAIYRRFQDKEAFENELLKGALAEGKEAIDDIFQCASDVEALAADLTRSIVSRHVFYGSIYKTALLRNINEKSTHSLTKRQARYVMDGFISWLKETQGITLNARQINHIHMAFQMFNGAIANAVIARPGPLLIEQDAFVTELSRGFALLLRNSISVR